VLFEGFREGVLPGVLLLSLWRLSGLPVDLAILFGPGLSGMIFYVLLLITLILKTNGKFEKLQGA